MNIKISKQRGSVLTAALVIGGVVGLTLSSYMVWANTHYATMKRSNAWNEAIPVLEAGIEEALSHLHDFPDNRGMNGWKLDGNVYTKTRWISSNAYWMANITSNTPPVIISSGYVKAPLQSDQYIFRSVRVTTTNKTIAFPGFAVKEFIDLNGNSLSVDVFDSTDPAYSTNGKYDPNKIKDDGSVVLGTNLGITNSLNNGNAKITGKVTTGPGGTVSIGAQGMIGDLAWQQNKANAGQIQPGWDLHDMNMDFPAITDCPTSGSTPIGGKVGKINYDYVLIGGVYKVSELTGGMYVSSDSTIVVTDKLSISGGDQIYIAPGATLKIYCLAPEATFGGSGIANTSANPANFQFYGMPSCKTVELKGGSSFVGVINAPDSNLILSGGGNSANFVGSSMTKSIKLSGGYNAHFDVSLKKSKADGFTATSWNEL